MARMTGVLPSLLAGLALVAPAPAATIVDPIGDAVAVFGAPGPLLDLTQVRVARVGADLEVEFQFAGPIAPASSLAPNSVVGGLDLDLDRNPATGDPPFQNNFAPPFTSLALGSEISIDLFSELFHPGFAGVFDNISHVFLSTLIPLTFDVDSISFSVPLSVLGNPEEFFFTAGFGTLEQPTDALDVRGDTVSVPAPMSLALLLAALPLLFVPRRAVVSRRDGALSP